MLLRSEGFTAALTLIEGSFRGIAGALVSVHGHNLDMSTPDGCFSDAPPAMRLVVMGVAGCGKSALGQRIAGQLTLPLIEGDDFHPASNIRKMQGGVALTDHDRAGWLAALGAQLCSHPGGAVLTCSALKLSYRNTLRRAASGLKFVHIAISQAESLKRVGERPGHFYPPHLVASQFEALEDPSAEPGVLTLCGDESVDQLAGLAVAWLKGSSKK